MDLKRIRNNSGVAQAVVFQGRQVKLDPYTEDTLDAVLADVFLAKCAPVVEEVEEDSLPTDPDSDEDVVWIANVTGSHLYPKEVDAKRLENKKWIHTKNKNPASEVYPIKRQYDPGQQPYTGRDGSWMTKNVPPVSIELKPFQRKAFKRSIAQWFLNREGVSTRLSGHSPAAIRSRKPVSYEPSMEWELDEIRTYLRLISAGTAPAFLSEKDIANKVRNDQLTQAELTTLLEDTKKAAVQAAWYYVCDSKYRLPTRSEVRELLTGKSAVEIVNSQVEKILDQATA